MRVSLAEHLADPTIWRGAATRSDLQSNRQDAHQGPRPRGHSRGHPTGQPGDRRADHPGGSFLKRTLAGALGALLAGAVTLASAAPAAQAQSIIRDEEIENLLRDYTNPILQAAGLQPEDVRIFVLNDPTLNAFVTGGQNIFLHTGLILAADTPNQLKGVIAHETGHIAGGHLVRSQQAMEVAMRPALLSMFLGVLAIAGGAPDAGAALIQNSQYWAALTFFRHTRVQESSADQSAVTYLEETGQSAQGLLDFFDKFRYQEVMSDARREPYFRSHPLSADRMQALRGRVQAQPHQTAADDARSLERFKLAQAKLYGFLEAPIRRRQHDTRAPSQPTASRTPSAPSPRPKRSSPHTLKTHIITNCLGRSYSNLVRPPPQSTPTARHSLSPRSRRCLRSTLPAHSWPPRPNQTPMKPSNC
jgi:Zn-dependent protease with chaperone function